MRSRGAGTRWGMTALLFVAACAGGAAGPASTSSTPTAGAETFLASGVFAIPAVEGIQDAPGFHEQVTATATVPSDLRASAGRTLVVRFRDRTRPVMTCSSEHPLSGCVTLDWSDFPERPKVPAGGAFDQRVTVATTAGSSTLHLSESGELRIQGDPYEPG